MHAKSLRWPLLIALALGGGSAIRPAAAAEAAPPPAERRARRERPAVAAPRRAPMPPEAAHPARRLRRDDRLNLLDAAYYDIAEIHLRREDPERAVQALRRLLQKSPDPFVRSLTHLNLAQLYHKELRLRDKAAEEYQLVTGVLALDALQQLARMFEQAGQVDQAVEQLEAVAKNAQDKTQKALALKVLADLLVRNHREDEAVSVLQRLTQTLTHDEAAAVTEALRAEQERRRKKMREQEELRRIRRIRAWRERFRARRPKPRRNADRVKPRRPDDPKGLKPARRPVENKPDQQ